MVNGRQVQMDPAKLETMSQWSIPTKEIEVQACLGFANYSRRLIENYIAKALRLVDVIKDVPFSWRHQQQQAFDEQSTRFLSPPILTQLDCILETIMETDASNQDVVGILSQCHSVNEAK